MQKVCSVVRQFHEKNKDAHNYLVGIREWKNLNALIHMCVYMGYNCFIKCSFLEQKVFIHWLNAKHSSVILLHCIFEKELISNPSQ